MDRDFTVDRAGWSFPDLPRSIRDNVYSLLFSVPDLIRPVPEGPIRQYLQPPRKIYSQLSVSIRLLRTCSQVRSEAIKILYGNNEFYLGSTRLSFIQSFIRRLGPKNLEELRNLSINFETLQIEYYAGEHAEKTDFEDDESRRSLLKKIYDQHTQNHPWDRDDTALEYYWKRRPPNMTSLEDAIVELELPAEPAPTYWSFKDRNKLLSEYGALVKIRVDLGLSQALLCFVE